MALDVAMGGSTNTVLHVLALAHEAGVDYAIERFNLIADRTPHLGKVSPAYDGARQWHMQDIHAAGGIPAILKELSKKPGILNLDCPTVTGKTVGENLAGVENKNPECIRPLDNPHSERGGLCVLFGNLAKEGAVIKVGAVEQTQMKVPRPGARLRRRRSGARRRQEEPDPARRRGGRARAKARAAVRACARCCN